MPLTEKQMRYLALAWQCFETEPKINYAKYKEVSGCASEASAREMMRVTKNKLREEYGALSCDVKTTLNKTPKKRATPAKKPKSPSLAEEEDDEVQESPSKKAKMTPTPKKAAAGKNVKAEPEVDGEEDELFQ